MMAAGSEESGVEASPRPAEPAQAPPETRPLSPAQLPIWHAEMLYPGTPRWTQFSITTLDGPVDRTKLQDALAATVAYYPALRTRLIRRHRHVWQAFHEPGGFRVGWQDLSALPAETRERVVAGILAEGARYRFEIYERWLFRAEVLACAPDRFLLLLFMHHVATDGMSLPLVLQRVALTYRGEATEGDPADRGRLQYERWVDRQNGPDLEPALRSARAFYRQALAGATLWHQRLYDREANGAAPREPPDLPESTCVLEPAVVQGLSRLAKQTASTLFIVCLAAYGAALSRVLDAEDLVIAVFVSGRGGESGLVAMAVNTLLVRLQLDAAMGAAELVRCAKEAWRSVRALEAAPVYALRHPARRGASEGVADTGAGPPPPAVLPNLAQCAMNFLDMRSMAFDLPGVSSRTTYPQSALPLNDALLLVFREQDDRLRLRLFNGSGTPRLSAGRLATVVEAMAGTLRGWSDAPAPTPTPTGDTP